MSFKFLLTVILFASCSVHLWSASVGDYAQTNLVSNIPGTAAVTDPNLINPWGVASSATSPFWVSDNGNGLSTLYNTAGTPQSLVVTIPSLGTGASAPTGQVFNGSGQFNGDNFIFASLQWFHSRWRI